MVGVELGLWGHGRTVALPLVPARPASVPRGPTRVARSADGGRADVVPGRVLAIYAHPDDPEVACAGTLASWVRYGSEVVVISAARGEKGAGGGSPEELASRRASESRSAAAILGVADWRTLGLDDGEIENTTELRRTLVGVIREVRPDAVLTSDPTAVFFGDSYVNHRDHREIGWAVLDAVSPAAANPSYYPEAGEAHRVSELYLSGTLEPTVWIDISTTIDDKIAALGCHQTQLSHAIEGVALDEGGGGAARADSELVAAVVRARAQSDGRVAGMASAESYRRVRLV